MNLYEPRILHTMRLINLYDFYLELQTALSFQGTLTQPGHGKTGVFLVYFCLQSELYENVQSR